MLAGRVDSLRKIKIINDDECVQEILVEVLGKLSNPVHHNNTQYAYDSGYAKALEDVVEIMIKHEKVERGF